MGVGKGVSNWLMGTTAVVLYNVDLMPLFMPVLRYGLSSIPNIHMEQMKPDYPCSLHLNVFMSLPFSLY